MIVIDGKEYRNLEEQVLKNMEDIETLKESGTDITTQDNTFTGTNTFNGSTTFKGNLYRPNTNGGGQLIVNNVMSGISFSDDGDQTGQVAVTSAGTSITGLVSPVNDNDAANKQYVDNAISDIDLSEYVQKTTQANKLYGTDGSGNDKTYAISRNPVDFTNDGIVQRGKDGNVYVPKSPLDDYSATSKYYVNNTKVAKVTTSNIVYGRGTGIEKAYGVETAATANKIPLRTAQGQITVPLTPTANNDATSKQYVDSVATAAGSTYTIQVESNTTPATITYCWKQGKMIIFYGQFNDGLNNGANLVNVASADTISHGYIQSADSVMAFGSIHDNYATFDEEVGATTSGIAFNGRNFTGVIWLA